MLEFLKEKKPTQFNKDTPASENKELKQMRKRVGMQLGLAALTILLTVVVVFGMTAAWYTNVVHSGGLIFEVEKMGVNVDAAVYANNFTAKPGDQGNISMEAENKGDKTVRITVSVSKAGMELPMRQRLFFYVEDQDLVNGELVERSYLTTNDTYTYTLFGGKSLTLTDAYHNNSPLKWCWVYDVLGYYVLGQAQEDTVAVEEYLRPIEYDYDSATFDAEGNLLTVDGTTSVDSFLNTVSQTDGYSGAISAANMVGRYYQVDVDENGYGVYAYLCTYAEVEDHTQYDTALGEDALQGNPATYTARFTVLAENVELTTVTVTDGTQLVDALTSGEAEVVQLGSDVVLDEGTGVSLTSGDVLLDLNGYTLSTNSSGYAWVLDSNAALTITDGTLNGNNQGNGFTLMGADLTLNNVNISGYNRSFQVADYSGTGQDSALRITGCNIQSNSHLLLLHGNGTASEQKTQVLVEDSELTSYHYVICGNGNLYGTGRWGTDVQIINSRIIQDISEGDVFSAVYHPQPNSTINIYDSYVSGYTGVVIKGGTMVIDKSEIYGVGSTPAAPELAKDGFVDTADAIYVETGYGYDIVVTIRDTIAESYYNEAYRVFEEDAPCVTATLEGNNIFTSKSKVTA